ncbi:MAG: DUF1194 domain-containing protein [Hyphomicrobiaceae bacterium]|nr:DUF1194 domain-containing protein [Hyphomicrobiaceae bacterium]
MAVLLLLASWAPPRLRAQEKPVDLELVLAVDVSLSMDLDEQRLQREGYVQAFRDPEVIKSIAAGPSGRIAVTYVEWAGPANQLVVLPWMIIDGAAAAQEFSRRLEQAGISRARMTSISSALEFSGGLFAESGVRGLRRVIDVSGDGPNNAGAPVLPIRDALVAKGVVINGLPIVLKRPTSYFDLENLDKYYQDCVIGGTGSFVIPIREPGEFRSATRRKLLLEIAGLAPPPEPRLIRVQAGRGDGEAPIDCLAGERRWNRFMREP